MFGGSEKIKDIRINKKNSFVNIFYDLFKINLCSLDLDLF